MMLPMILFTQTEAQHWQDALLCERIFVKKVAIPEQFFAEWLDPEVKRVCLEAIEKLREQWAEITWIDMPILKYSVPTYYILCPAEVSTNMARFDGVRFGLQGDTSEFERIHDYYASKEHSDSVLK